MGYADVISTLGDGQYTINIRRDKEAIEAKITWLNNKILTCPLDQMPTLVKRRDVLEALLINDNQDVWCADYTTTMATSLVETMEIDGEPGTSIIKPQTPGHTTLSTRDLKPLVAQSTAQAFFNFSIYPGWQKFQPTYRIGYLSNIDYSAHTATVHLDGAFSHYGGANINQAAIINDVPIRYMTCNSIAFNDGDRVVVEFQDNNPDSPRVVGFESDPQQCTDALIAIIAAAGGDAVAWDLYNDTMLLPKDTLGNITTTLACLGYGAPIQATMSSQHAETWTIEAAASDTYKGLYTQATYLEGSYVGLASAGYELSISRPVNATLSYPATGGHEWDYNYKYLEAPTFVKSVMVDVTEHKKGAQSINLKLFPSYTNVTMADLFRTLTGATYEGNTWIKPWPDSCVDPFCPYGPERTYYYHHSIFDIKPGWAIKETLDSTCTELLDSWADVSKGGTAPNGDYYNIDFTSGIAETSTGAVVYECAQACDNVNVPANECEDLNFSDRRIFRIFAHKKGAMSGVPNDLLTLINAYRVANGKKELLQNIGLIKAAQAHAIDCAANDLSGHIGSDGSSIQDRMTTAGYYLWLNAAVTVSKEEIVEVDTSLTAVGVFATWQATPAYDAIMLSASLKEVGGYISTGGGKSYLVFVFGGLSIAATNSERWPGFCPVDTTNIDSYFLTNFDFSGDQLRLPDVYIL